MSTQEAERDQEEAVADGGANASTGEPAEAEATKSAEVPSEPARSESASSEPIGDEPTSTEPTSTEPVGDEPTSTEPVGAEPTSAEPTAATKPEAASKSASAAAPSAGQRIAAQRAAKAAKKAADKSRRAEEAAAAREAEDELGSATARTTAPVGPDEAELRAAEVGRLVESNTPRIMRVLAVASVLIVVGVAVQFYLASRSEAAGRSLAHALAASAARIGPNPEIPDGHLHFGSEAARDAEALRRYRAVVSAHEGSDAARRARLAIATLLIGQGKFAEAQAEIRSARADLVDDEVQLDAALREANGLAFLGQSKFAEARREFEALARIDRPRNADVAEYLLARTAFEQGDRAGAKTRLVALVDRLDDEGATPAPHVQDQAIALLRAIDPSAAPARSLGGGGIDFSSLPPEILRALQQQGFGGEGGPQ